MSQDNSTVLTFHPNLIILLVISDLDSLSTTAVCTQITTLIHTFVSRRADYCRGLIIRSSRSVTDKLQRFLKTYNTGSTNR